MTHTIVQYGKSLSADTDRWPSPGLWGNCPILEFQLKHNGFYFFDDFMNMETYAAADNKKYATYGDTGVTWTPQTGALTGVMEVAGNDADHDQIAITANSGAGAMVAISDTAGANKEMWFEARLKQASIGALDLAYFIGVAAAGSAANNGLILDASQAMANTSFIGFHADGADANVDCVHAAGGASTVVHQAAAHTTVADTYVKLGLYFDGTTMFWYVNGVKANATGVLPAASQFPDGTALTLAFSCKTAVLAAVLQQTDWWAIAQRFDAS